VDDVIGHLTPSAASADSRFAIEHGGLFALREQGAFPFAQRLDTDGVVDRVGTISYVAGLAEDERARILARVREAVAPFGSEVEFPYVSEVFLCERL
jgi:hypothetical protein